VEVPVFVTVAEEPDAPVERTACDEEDPGEVSVEVDVPIVVAAAVSCVVVEDAAPWSGPRLAPPINPVEEKTYAPRKAVFRMANPTSAMNTTEDFIEETKNPILC